jgi:hypothetical protein
MHERMAADKVSPLQLLQRSIDSYICNYYILIIRDIKPVWVGVINAVQLSCDKGAGWKQLIRFSNFSLYSIV